MTIKINSVKIENVKRVKAVKVDPTPNGRCSRGTFDEQSGVAARSSGIATSAGSGWSAVRGWMDVALEGAFVVGLAAGLGYAAALLMYTLVVRWLGG